LNVKNEREKKMSDPTARRGDHLTALMNAMTESKRGWTRGEMKRFLFRRYRGGVRKQTIDGIIADLLDNNWIIGKPRTKRSNVYVYFATGQHNIEYEREKEREREREREKEKKKTTEKRGD